MTLATQLTVLGQGHHPAAPLRPIAAGHKGTVGDTFHLEPGSQVVGAASKASVRPPHGRTFAVQRPVDTGGKAQRGLICRDPWLFPQSFAALPADLVVVEVSSSAARAKGHGGSLFLGNLLGSASPGRGWGRLPAVHGGMDPGHVRFPTRCCGPPCARLRQDSIENSRCSG